MIKITLPNKYFFRPAYVRAPGPKTRKAKKLAFIFYQSVVFVSSPDEGVVGK